MHRITVTAQRLTADRGLDGFTLDELAEAVDVSRRTLFNYYPSKIDAVLGPAPDLSEGLYATFVSGGPTGDLVEDLIDLCRRMVTATDLSSDELRLGREVMLAEPRLLAAAHERFAAIGAGVAGYLAERSGNTIGLDGAQLLVRVLAATFDAALDQTLAGDDIDSDRLADMVATNIRTLRDLFAGSSPRPQTS